MSTSYNHNKIFILVLGLTFFASSTQAQLQPANTSVPLTIEKRTLPHLDPGMTGEDYLALFKSMARKEKYHAQFNNLEAKHLFGLNQVADNSLEYILVLGKRNIDWVEKINQNRDNAHKLRLTTPEMARSFPIEAPTVFSPKIIQNKLKELREQMPKAMADIIFSTNALPPINPIDDETFLISARKLNGIYAHAARWMLEAPQLSLYTELAYQDIRGYYFLQKEADLNCKLHNWYALDAASRRKYSDWLIGECFNSTKHRDVCENKLKHAIRDNQVLAYHLAYVEGSRELYNQFFELEKTRPEIVWKSSNPNFMIVPFNQPDSLDVEDWFKTNVEDEYRLDNWALKINFSHGTNLGRIQFEPGVTAHANRAGTITMDPNLPLHEYNSRLLIRHEFGHVLGFPDCYVEFYDTKNAVMVNYQLDVTNIMCSARGHFQKQHYEELKKHYYDSITWAPRNKP